MSVGFLEWVGCRTDSLTLTRLRKSGMWLPSSRVSAGFGLVNESGPVLIACKFLLKKHFPECQNRAIGL